MVATRCRECVPWIVQCAVPRIALAEDGGNSDPEDGGGGGVRQMGPVNGQGWVKVWVPLLRWFRSFMGERKHAENVINTLAADGDQPVLEGNQDGG